MSCERCELEQELRGPEQGLTQVFVRAGTGNVELVGCREHVAELVSKLRLVVPELPELGPQGCDLFDGPL